MRRLLLATAAFLMLGGPAVANPPSEASFVNGQECQRVYVRVSNPTEVPTDYRVQAIIASRWTQVWRSPERNFTLDAGESRTVSFAVRPRSEYQAGIRVSHFGVKFFDTSTHARGCDVAIR